MTIRRRLARLCNLALAVCVLCVTQHTARAAPARGHAGDVVIAEAVLASLERGDARAAAASLRNGLQAFPSSVLLHNLAGTVLLLSGDTSGSERFWTASLGLLPGDSVALYGRALLRVASGDLAEADALLRQAMRGGDAAVCLLALEYVAWLRGSLTGEVAALPAALERSRLGLLAAVAEGRGEAHRVLELTDRLLKDPQAGRYQEYSGVLMTLDKRRPLRWGLPPLPRGVLEPRGPSGPTVSGVVVLRSEESDAAYVAFRLDGQLLAVVNGRPYQFNWDSSTVANGPHVVEVIAYDASGQEIRRTRKEFVTANARAPRLAEDPALQARLWRLLALRVSRASAALLCSRAARAAGDAEGADRLANLAAAIAPEAVPSSAWPDPGPRPAAGQVLWSAPAAGKFVALTFDDGPRPGVTEAILEILERENVRATFFLIGRHVAAHPELAMRLARAGMELGNHSFTHPNLANLAPEEIREELLRTSACIRDVTGAAPAWLRSPGGHLRPVVTRQAQALGMGVCMWTVNGERKELEGAHALTSFVLQRVQPGSVVLLHNGRQSTVDALPRMIAELKRRGYMFVTVSQLYARMREVETTPVMQPVLQ